MNQFLQNICMSRSGLRRLSWLLTIAYIMLNFSCRDNTDPIAVKGEYTPPAYTGINLAALQDTIHFALESKTFNKIKSFNYFNENNKSYISFYDRRSESVAIYDFTTRQLVSKIVLKKVFHKRGLFKG